MIYLVYISIVVIFLIYFWIRKGAKAADFKDIHESREKVNAPKILYLRSFQVDGDDEGTGNISALQILPKELDLANAFIKYNYHLVAVGNPNEDLPEIGFDRKK